MTRRILLVIVALIALLAIFTSGVYAKGKTTVKGLKQSYKQKKAIVAKIKVSPANGRAMFLAYYEPYSFKWKRVKRIKLPNKKTAIVKVRLTGHWRAYATSVWRLRVPEGKKNKEGTIKTKVFNPLALNAKCAGVYDVTNKKFIYAKAVKNKWRLASITKLMTGVLLVENAKMNEVITTEVESTGFLINLKPGDTFDADTALAAMMLASANDAAVNAGLYLSKKIAPKKDFKTIMNERAKRLGMKETNYKSACGHLSTSPITDQVKLISYIINKKTPEMKHMKEILQMPSYTGRVNGEPIEISTRNKILGTPECVWGKGGVIGPTSGYCFANYFMIKGRPYISIVYGCTPEEERWKDTKALCNYARTSVNNNYMKIKIK